MKKRICKSIAAVLICLGMVCNSALLSVMAEEADIPELSIAEETDIPDVNTWEETIGSDESAFAEAAVYEALGNDEVPDADMLGDSVEEEEPLEEEEMECERYGGSYEPDGASYNLTYEELEDGTLKITGSSGTRIGYLVIPAEIDGKAVTVIEAWAFASRTGFTRVTIPDSVKTIGEGAFSGCKNLGGDLIIPDSVTTIGAEAFNGCTALSGSLTIPDSVTTIGEGAFNNCSGFDGCLTIGNGITTIKNETFSGCKKLTGSLMIPDGVTEIGDSAFDGCKNLDGNLRIPDGVITIGNSAFNGCSGLKGDLTIPDGLTVIGDSTFKDCSGLKGNLTIPDGVTVIGAKAFYGCTSLNGSLTIPDGVTQICTDAFSDCSKLTGNLTIPDSVTWIGSAAFYNCSGFTGNLMIPDGVTSIEVSAFYGCSGFTGNLTIPDSVTQILHHAFEGCRGFDGNLTIGKSVTFLGADAFADCSGFTGSLTIPESVELAFNEPFTNCNGFRKVVNRSGVDYELPTVGEKTWINAETGEEIPGGTVITRKAVIRSDFYDPMDAPYFTHKPVNDQTYTGKAIKPAVEVYFGTTLLEEKKDYTITYRNNTNAGTASFTVTGKGNYTGSDSDSFMILRKDLAGTGVVLTEPAAAKYTKKEQNPIPKITYNGMTLKKGKDFDLAYFSDAYFREGCIPKEPGTYYIRITGIGNYEGELKTTFVIANPKRKLMSSLRADKIKVQDYANGTPITLDETKLVIRDGGKTLQKGEDYLVDDDTDYSDNIYPGTAKVTVHGVEKNGYVGTLTLSFQIKGTPISRAKITAPADVTYDGTAQSPEPVVDGLEKDTDYELIYDKNTNAGKAKVIIKGIGGYTGSVSKTFTIKPAALTDEMISLDQEDPYEYPYSGSGVKPVATATFSGITLKEGRDYTVKYTNNTTVTTDATTKRPTVTVTGKGNFAGKADKKFKIVPANLNECQVTANAVVYTEKKGNWKTKKITILGVDGKALKAGKDYDDKTIRYTHDAGGTDEIGAEEILNAKDVVYVTVQSKGTTYTGSVMGNYTIAAQDIGKFTASLDPKAYTGKVIKLSRGDIKWKLGGKVVNDVTFDFDDSTYTNNVNKGKAAVVVRGTGNYGGRKTLTFTIGSKGILWWWRNLFN